MLDRHDKQLEPVKELDSVHAGDTHVEEDTEEDGAGYELEQGTHEHGQAQQY